jgi:hypothetical protein
MTWTGKWLVTGIDCGVFVGAKANSDGSSIKDATVATYHRTQKFCIAGPTGGILGWGRAGSGFGSEESASARLLQSNGSGRRFWIRLSTPGIASKGKKR